MSKLFDQILRKHFSLFEQKYLTEDFSHNFIKLTENERLRKVNLFSGKNFILFNVPFFVLIVLSIPIALNGDVLKSAHFKMIIDTYNNIENDLLLFSFLAIGVFLILRITDTLKRK